MHSFAILDGVALTHEHQDLIKVRGWQVSPTEIETVLLMHPSIVDAAVIGVKLSGKGPIDELPRAYVVTGGDGPRDVDELEVMQYVKDRLASFKALDGGVKFVDSIPRNHNGKILRRVLEERALVEVASRTGDTKISTVTATVAGPCHTK